MINNLQVLRAIAAYMVVLHHVQPFIINIHPSVKWLGFGGYGVDVFFVISGFIMVYTNRASERTPAQFWRERAIRILPMYWLVTLVLVALYFVGFRPAGLHGWNVKDLLMSMLLLPNVRVDGVAEPILTLGWSLIYEMFFYFIFGCLLVLKNQRRAAIAITVIFAALTLIGAAVRPASFAMAYYSSPIALEFAAGCLLGVAYTERSIFAHRRARLAGLICIVAGVLAFAYDDTFYREAIWQSRTRQAIMVGAPAFLIVAGALALEKSGWRYTGRFGLLQGAASYSIYLVHPLAIQPVYKTISKLVGAASPTLTTVMTLIAIVVAGVIGTAMHLYLEKPVSRYLHDWRARRVQTQPLAVP